MEIAPFVSLAFRQFRQRVEMSQEEIVLWAGLDRTYVSGIERGRRNPSLKSMQRIAAELAGGLVSGVHPGPFAR